MSLNPAYEAVGVSFSRESSVEIAGRFVSAFQRDSFLARVEFRDGEVVVVAGPKGANRRYTTQPYPTVLAEIAARRIRSYGQRTGYLFPGDGDFVG